MKTFASLKEYYGGFAVPVFKITSGGAELKRSECSFEEIVVDNCMGETAGAARFTLTDVYERGSRQFSVAALEKLIPGKQVSVSLGYGSSVTEVFTGYIGEVRARFLEDDMALTAVCLDARALMRDGSAFASTRDKSVLDVVTAVADRYSPLVNKKDFRLASLEQEVNITQAGGDLEFLCDAARKRGHYFYIDCGKAVIGAADATVCVAFDWEQFGIEISVRYLDEKLTAYGYDAKRMEAFTAEVTAKNTAKQASLLTVARAQRQPLYLGAKAAKEAAAGQASARVAAAVSGTISCVGLPEIKLGQKVKINKFPLTSMGVGDTFIVVSVHHRLTADGGFSTEIGIEGG